MSGWGVGGRPKVHFERRLEDYPPPTPQPTRCRLWQGAVDRDGYGIINVTVCDMVKSHGRKRAHRWVWEAVYGPLIPELVVRHKCDNRPCFRLSHLEIGTVADNNRDTVERNHAGAPWKVSPSQVERIRAEREAGMSYGEIWRGWPELHEIISWSSLKAIGLKLQRGEVPPPPAPAGWVPRDPLAKLRKIEEAERQAAKELARYSEWRNRDPVRSDPLGWLRDGARQAPDDETRAP